MASEGLKFIAVSGTTGATENLYLYEYGDDILIVDCGVGFPDQDMFGVDLVIPDFTYIKENKKKLKGLIVTHGHEDHLGAIPFLLKDVNVPIFATRLTAGFIKDKLVDHQIKGNIKTFDPEKDVLKIGVFKVHPFRVSHSVPDGVGLAIDTPEGMCFHVPDYKFDWSSVDKKPFDVRKAAMLASRGVLALASDALGSTTPGHTESEKVLEERIENVVSKATGRVFFTTISSNISRMQQALDVAQRHNRKIVFIGRSIDSKSDIAKRLGYLHYPNSLVINPHKAKDLKDENVMYIISGCYGQPGSALYRATMGEHRFLNIDSSDTVIFSADPAPPGSKINVDFLVDRLFEMGVDVHYYDLQEDLHVSGHGSQEDIKFLLGLVNPKYYIPIGGTVRHMRAYAQIARDMGAGKGDVLELMPGSVVEFKSGVANRRKSVPSRAVLVDGLGVGDVGNMVLRDRQVLARDGFVIAILQVDRETGKLTDQPEIVTRGFVFEKHNKQFIDQAVQSLDKAISSGKTKEKAQSIKSKVVETLEVFFFEKLGRRPMILPVVIEV